MERLKTVVAVFCTACICAELVGRLLGDVHGRQCIKTAAGLYIVASLFHALPGAAAGAADFVLPQAEPAQFGTAGEAILRQAGQDLAGRLAAQIAEETGLAVQLSVTLEQTDTGVRAARLAVALPAACTPQQQAAAQALLCEALGIDAPAIAWSREEG